MAESGAAGLTYDVITAQTLLASSGKCWSYLIALCRPDSQVPLVRCVNTRPHIPRHRATAPPMRPDPMTPTTRRPREVDTSRHFCPHATCEYRGDRRGRLRLH